MKTIYVDETGRRIRPPKAVRDAVRDGRRSSSARSAKPAKGGKPKSPAAGQAGSAAVAFAIVGTIAVSLHGHHPAAAGRAAAGIPVVTAAKPARGGTPAGWPAATGPGVPWSVFSNGPGPAVTWAFDLLHAAGVPASPANVRFIWDWMMSEGSGGSNNPLNQGPVPGQPQLTCSGQQFGGGAACYVSRAAGLAGAAAYLHMPNYAGVLAALERSDYRAAAASLWGSYWAGNHYGDGANWNTSSVPGRR